MTLRIVQMNVEEVEMSSRKDELKGNLSAEKGCIARHQIENDEGSRVLRSTWLSLNPRCVRSMAARSHAVELARTEFEGNVRHNQDTMQ